MQLRELISDFSYRVIKGSLDKEIFSFTCDSKRISPGCMFVCIHGQEHDGLEFIKDALECQAAVLVTERLSDSIISLCNQAVHCEIDSHITILLVANTKKALALISARFYDCPANKMTMIGITGTKGKTTTAYMLQSIFKVAGIPCGLIGTNGWTYDGVTHDLSHTTPPAPELHEILNQMYQNGCTHVVMEVSSIGVKEQRVYGIHFAYGIYTNLFCDHIGGKEHSSFEEYKYWKSQFFTQCEVGIFNQNDLYWREMAKKCSNVIMTYRLEGENDEQNVMLEQWIPNRIQDKIQAQYISLCQKQHFEEQEEKGLGSELAFTWNNQKERIFVPLPGKANSTNALAAIFCALCCNIDRKEIAMGIEQVVVKGRTELVCSGDGISVFIDYAHNGDSLRQILTALRSYNPKKLICLFGCGGDRSKERRYPMGMASGTLADLTIITEDNSRNENPKNIIEEIRQGVEDAGGKYIVIENRAEAIKWAITNACCGDVILLAGKGHEAYQEKGGVKTPFSEHEIVMECWNIRNRFVNLPNFSEKNKEV